MCKVEISVLGIHTLNHFQSAVGNLLAPISFESNVNQSFKAESFVVANLILNFTLYSQKLGQRQFIKKHFHCGVITLKKAISQPPTTINL